MHMCDSGVKLLKDRLALGESVFTEIPQHSARQNKEKDKHLPSQNL